MTCVVDKYIPFIQGRLEKVFDHVEYLDPAQITNAQLSDADALIIRTRTQCNQSLLHNTSVRFIGTATIGTDHIDFDYCSKHGITAVSAPGCNARGVAQYVESAISALNLANKFSNRIPTIGIIGVGHVGRLIEQMAKRLGFNTMLYDPPRQRAEGGNYWVKDLSDIAHNADIITFHVPLTMTGQDKTYHLADESFIEQCKKDAVIINAARGGIVDEQALIKHAERRSIVIDTWENEPHINTVLLDIAKISTPHIAGYTEEGKRNATRMILEKLSEYLGKDIDVSDLLTKTEPLPTYDIMQYNKLLRTSPHDFEHLRQTYTLR